MTFEISDHKNDISRYRRILAGEKLPHHIAPELENCSTNPKQIWKEVEWCVNPQKPLEQIIRTKFNPMEKSCNYYLKYLCLYLRDWFQNWRLKGFGAQGRIPKESVGS